MSTSLPEDRRAAACQALNDAENHLKAQVGIPEALRPALVQAEANCRGNRGYVMSVATIDGKRLVKVPDHIQGESLFHWLWETLVASDEKSIHFAYAGDDDTLCAIYLSRDEGYVASATIISADTGIEIGDWRVKKMERR
jgi:hypothetical protein